MNPAAGRGENAVTGAGLEPVARYLAGHPAFAGLSPACLRAVAESALDEEIGRAHV